MPALIEKHRPGRRRVGIRLRCRNRNNMVRVRVGGTVNVTVMVNFFRDSILVLIRANHLKSDFV